jgi:thioredoxin 1
MKLIKLGATWCSPCKVLSKIIEDIDLGPYTLVEIDVDSQREQAMKYNIRGVPVLVVEDDNGNELRRSVGFLSQDKLKEFLKI